MYESLYNFSTKYLSNCGNRKLKVYKDLITVSEEIMLII